MGEIGEVYAIVIGFYIFYRIIFESKVVVYDLLLGNNIRRGIGRILEIASLARLRPLYVIRCAYRHFSRMSGSRAIPCFAVHGSLRIRLDLRSRCLAPPISSYIRSWHRWSLISGVCPDFYMPACGRLGALVGVMGAPVRRLLYRSSMEYICSGTR